MEKETVNPGVQKVDEAGTKWHGYLKEIIQAPIDKAWEISGNFCGLNKWLKTCQQCDKIEGEYQQPGCVRYVIGNSFPRPDGSRSWAKEKLLSFDGENHSMSYAMLGNNFGLVGYVSHFKLQDLGNGTSLVDWSFEVNPSENRTEEQTAEYMTSGYRNSLRILEDLVRSPSSE